MSGFALADHGASDGHAMRVYIFDLQADDMQPRGLLSMFRLSIAKSLARSST